MHRVFISPGSLHIERQLPKKSLHIVGNCEFVFDNDENYDYFVTIDNITEECECKVDKSHRLLFLGEPPYIKQYNDDFINQYGYVYSCQQKKVDRGEAILSFPLLAWMIGISLKENCHSALDGYEYLTYDDFKKLAENPDRVNKACLITSNKVMTKGHRDRVRFADYALNYCSDYIDVYGNGYKSIPDKLEVLSQYKYAIIIENCQYPNYWTEKIGDCFLAGCYPIYHGCPNIGDYFPKGSLTEVNVRNIIETTDKIKNILDSKLFKESTEKLMEAKNLVLDKYNIFSQISKRVTEIEKDNGSVKKTIIKELLCPMQLSFLDKVKQMIAWKLNIII